MGQQQLLLLVLGIVIVGLAVVAGINAFDENQTRSQKDALLNEGFRIATDLQAHALKPAQLGGGGGSLPGSFADVGLRTNGDDNYQTAWGEISYDNESGVLTLMPSGNDETAQIEISTDGAPSLSKSWGTSEEETTSSSSGGSGTQ